MICAVYWAVVKDRKGNELCRAKAWSFDEAYWDLSHFRDMYLDGWYFIIEYTNEKEKENDERNAE